MFQHRCKRLVEANTNIAPETVPTRMTTEALGSYHRRLSIPIGTDLESPLFRYENDFWLIKPSIFQ